MPIADRAVGTLPPSTTSGLCCGSEVGFHPYQCAQLNRYNPSPEFGADMRRREFIAALSGAAAAWPLAVRAQQQPRRVYRVGYLSIASRFKAFEEGLRSVGYRAGENIVIEARFTDAEMGRLPATRWV